MSSSRLLISLMLVGAVAGTQLFANIYSTSTDCSDSSAMYSLEAAQDVCSCYALSAGSCFGYQKIALSGSDYTWSFYTDSACTSGTSPTGATAGTCQTLGTFQAYGISVTTSAASGSLATLTCSATDCTASSNSAGTVTFGLVSLLSLVVAWANF